MTYDIIVSDLKSGTVSPLYLFHGEEPYYIDKLTNHIEEYLLSDSEKAFNQVVLYGKDVDILTIIDEARQYPMMSSKRLIIIKEAQQMKTLTDLLPYIENAVPTTVLVICYKYSRLDKRTKFAKILEQKAVVFESKRIYENQVPTWIREYLKNEGYQASAGVGDLLAEYLGADLSKISNELDKLMLNVPKSKQITAEDVKEQIGISKEFDVFELQKMLGEKNFTKAALIAKYLSENQTPNPSVVVIASLFVFFNKVMITKYHSIKNDQELSRITGVNPFFMKDYRTAAKNYSIPQLLKIFNTLKTSDQASKGVGIRRVDIHSIYKDILISCMIP